MGSGILKWMGLRIMVVILILIGYLAFFEHLFLVFLWALLVIYIAINANSSLIKEVVI